MDDSKLIERLAKTDVFPAARPLPEGWSSDTVLRDLERRMGMDTRDTSRQSAPQGVGTNDPTGTSSPATAKSRWSGPLLAAAVFIGVVAVAAIVGVVWLRSDDASSAASEGDAFGVDDAQEANDAYFAAYAAGDVDGMLALLAPDASLGHTFGSITVENWEELYVWKLAEGTELTTPECTATETEPGIVTVRCSYAHHEGISSTVGGPAVPHNMTMVVTVDGVTRIQDLFGSPGFGVVGDPFESWVNQNHPEDTAAGCCGWDSIEQAQEDGLLRVRYAEEWAAYLEENAAPSTRPADASARVTGRSPVTLAHKRPEAVHSTLKAESLGPDRRPTGSLLAARSTA